MDTDKQEAVSMCARPRTWPRAPLNPSCCALALALLLPSNPFSRARAPSRSEYAFKKGLRYKHDKHGPGQIIAVTPMTDLVNPGMVEILFDSGETHRYRGGSQYKLDAFTPFANGAALSADGTKLAAHPKSFYEKLRRAVSLTDKSDAIIFMELLLAHITGHAQTAHACSKQIAASLA